MVFQTQPDQIKDTFENKVLVEFFLNGVNLCDTLVDIPISKRKSKLVTAGHVAVQAIEGIVATSELKTAQNKSIHTETPLSQLKYKSVYRNLKICFEKCASDFIEEHKSSESTSFIRRLRELGGFKIPVIIPLIAATIWIGTYQADKSDKVCFGNLDCFPLNEPWSQRPPIFNFVPQSPTAIKTSFSLFSRKSVNEFPFLLSRIEDVLSSPTDFVHKRLYIIIHGYMDDTSTWASRLKDALINKADVVVLLVDWRLGAKMYYPQVVANTRVVSVEISMILEKFHKATGNTAENVHLIGHSLGSMIAGYVGKRIKGIGKITGLDPASPLFEGYDGSMRLCESDAKIVEIIHSNVGPLGFGFRKSLGTIDIYLNDGRDQPGCKKMHELLNRPISPASFSGIQDDVACSHRRAYEIYIDLIKRNVSFPVQRCGSWELALNLNTSCEIYADTNTLGFSVWDDNLETGIYKMTTSDSSPF